MLLLVFSGLKVLRFCLYENGFRFGKEGRPSTTNDIVTHGELGQGDRCLAAGTIAFTSDNKIAGLSNSSGHFKPHYQTLQLVFKNLFTEKRFQWQSVISLGILTDSKIYPPYKLKTATIQEKLTALENVSISSSASRSCSLSSSSSSVSSNSNFSTPPRVTKRTSASSSASNSPHNTFFSSKKQKELSGPPVTPPRKTESKAVGLN